MTKSTVREFDIFSDKSSKVLAKKAHHGMSNIFQVKVVELLETHWIEVLRVLKDDEDDVEQVKQLSKIG